MTSTENTAPATNPVAVAMVKEMLVRNDAETESNRRDLDHTLAVLEARMVRVREQLARGEGIEGDRLRSAAAAVEQALGQRDWLARNERSLLHVLKAAGGE